MATGVDLVYVHRFYVESDDDSRATPTTPTTVLSILSVLSWYPAHFFPGGEG